MQLPVGYLTDRFGPRRLVVLAAVLLASGSAIFALSPSIAVAYLGRALIGLGSSFLWIAALTLAAQWFGPGRFTTLTDLSQLAGTLGAMAGQGPAALAVAWIGWRDTSMAGAVFCAVAGVAIWLVVRDRPASLPPSARSGSFRRCCAVRKSGFALSSPAWLPARSWRSAACGWCRS
jgi:MFS family permease